MDAARDLSPRREFCDLLLGTNPVNKQMRRKWCLQNASVVRPTALVAARSEPGCKMNVLDPEGQTDNKIE